MLYELVRDFYSFVTELDVSNYFSSGYALAGIDFGFSCNPEERGLGSIATFMGGRNRFHKGHENPQHTMQRAGEPIPVATTRGERDHTPGSVVGADGKLHHINRYKREEAPKEDGEGEGDKVRETIRAIEISTDSGKDRKNTWSRRITWI